MGKPKTHKCADGRDNGANEERCCHVNCLYSLGSGEGPVSRYAEKRSPNIGSTLTDSALVGRVIGVAAISSRTRVRSAGGHIEQHLAATLHVGHGVLDGR
jgi:hypothetical protein